MGEDNIKSQPSHPNLVHSKLANAKGTTDKAYISVDIVSQLHFSLIMDPLMSADPKSTL